MLFIIANLEAFSLISHEIILVPKHSRIAFTEKYRDKKSERKSKRNKKKPPLIISMSKKEIPNAFVCSYPIIL